MCRSGWQHQFVLLYNVAEHTISWIINSFQSSFYLMWYRVITNYFSIHQCSVWCDVVVNNCCRTERVSIIIWTYYNACMFFVDVEPYKLTVLRHHWHCWLCSYCHNIISSGSPSVFHECTSNIYSVPVINPRCYLYQNITVVITSRDMH